MSFFKGKKEMDEEFKEKLRMIEETKREIEEKIRKVHGKVPDVFGIGESIGYLAYKLEKERGNLDTKDLREMFTELLGDGVKGRYRELLSILRDIGVPREIESRCTIPILDLGFGVLKAQMDGLKGKYDPESDEELFIQLMKLIETSNWHGLKEWTNKRGEKRSPRELVSSFSTIAGELEFHKRMRYLLQKLVLGECAGMDKSKMESDLLNLLYSEILKEGVKIKDAEKSFVGFWDGMNHIFRIYRENQRNKDERDLEKWIKNEKVSIIRSFGQKLMESYSKGLVNPDRYGEQLSGLINAIRKIEKYYEKDPEIKDELFQARTIVEGIYDGVKPSEIDVRKLYKRLVGESG